MLELIAGLLVVTACVGVGSVVLEQLKRPSTRLEARKTDHYELRGRRVVVSFDSQRASLKARLRHQPVDSVAFPTWLVLERWDLSERVVTMVARMPERGLDELVKAFVEALDKLDGRGWPELAEQIGGHWQPDRIEAAGLRIWLEEEATHLRFWHSKDLPEGYELGTGVHGDKAEHLLLGMYLRELDGPVEYSDEQAEALMAVLHAYPDSVLTEDHVELRLDEAKARGSTLVPLVRALYALREALA